MMCGGGGSRRSQTSGTSSSGSGGSAQDDDSVRYGSGEIRSEDGCQINEETDLANCKPDVLNDISIGDIFPVEMRDGRICVVDFEGRVVGSVLGSLADRLEQCIEEGWQYRAEIIRVDGRNCHVRIKNKCSIDDNAMLSSLDPDVLSNISEDDWLDIVIHNNSLCAVDNSGQIVGSLAEAWTGVLIQCVEEGREYQAEVRSINGGNCTVHITDTGS